MQIYYKVVEANPDENQVVARFWSDITPEASLATQWDEEGAILRTRTDVALSLPIPAPTGEALEAFILGYFPTNFFEMKASIAQNGVDSGFAGIAALQGIDKQAPPPVVPPAPTLEQLTKTYLDAVQKFMDDAARAYGYDNLLFAVSYCALPGKYQAESITFFNWRTDVWAYCTGELEKVKLGTRPLPTIDEILLELPARALP